MQKKTIPVMQKLLLLLLLKIKCPTLLNYDMVVVLLVKNNCHNLI